MQGHLVRAGPGQVPGGHHIAMGGPRLQTPGPGPGPGPNMGPMTVGSYGFNSPGVLTQQQRSVPPNIVQLQRFGKSQHMLGTLKDVEEIVIPKEKL